MRKALRPLVLLAVLSLLLAPPAAAQVDFTRFVQVGDSLTAGFLDGCWVEHGQRNGYGAVLAAQAGADFQQPLIKEPGVGSGLGPGKGCLVLTSLVPAPTFTRKESVLVPLNLSLPRPYNNLAVPGFKIKDVTDSRSAADNGNPLTDVVLRGQGTALQQAAALRPTFVTVFIGNNDVLGAVTSGTVVEGLTLTPLEVAAPKLKTIFDTLKASQATVKGVAMNIPDVTSIPFVTAVPPVISVGGRTVTDPATGKPMTYLSRKVEKILGIPTGNVGPVASIPSGSLLTLNAAAFLASGYGIPCAVFTAGGVPAGDPRRANCDKPLPDDLDTTTGTPGVVLYPDEIANARDRTNQINAVIDGLAQADGYELFDTHAFFDDFRQNGREIGGITITADFLSGGFFSYDGVHPTSLGQALFARELIFFLNDRFRANLPDVDLSPFLAPGVPGPGVGLLSNEERAAAAASVFTPERWRDLKAIFGLFDAPRIVEPGDGPAPVRGLPDRDPGR